MADSWRYRLRRAANRALHPLGLHLTRRDRAFEMDDLLARAARNFPALATWIDVGASDGTWSLRARRHFPHCRFVLFEPLAERRSALDALHRRHGFDIVSAAAGAAPGTIEFAIDAALDGSGVAAPGAVDARRVAVSTIDLAVSERALRAPLGLKLDTHGHELAVLAGAATSLAAVELLVIEAYNFTLVPGCPRFPELCAWLEQRGFRCCDIADPMSRPGDGALWQMDLAFARTTHPMFRSATFD